MKEGHMYYHYKWYFSTFNSRINFNFTIRYFETTSTTTGFFLGYACQWPRIIIFTKHYS